MKRLPKILAAIFIWALVFAWHAQAAPEQRQHLPTVRNGQVVATTCDGSAPLLDEDTGALSAVRDADGRYIVAAQLRSRGSRAYILQHVGAELIDLGTPQLAGIQPQLSPSGAKQGSLALVPSNIPGGKSRLYYTQRVVDETPNEGPYAIWCMEF